MKPTLTIVFLLVTGIASSQSWDSLHFKLANDTLFNKSIHKSDSIATSFQAKADSINNWYQQQYLQVDSMRTRLQTKIDSLSGLQLPTSELSYKIDSLNHSLTEKLKACNRKMADLKSQATEQLHALQLPPELNQHVQKLEYAVNEYSLPTLNTSMDTGFKTLQMPNLGDLKLPTLSNQLNLGDEFGSYTKQLSEVKQLTSDYTKDLQQLTEGNLNEVQHLDKTLEHKLADMDGVDQLQEGTSLVKNLATDSAAIAEKAKEIVKEELMELAQDHFAGQKEVLMQAMDRISKLKTKYRDVSSLAELPIKQPNPLKGKPLIERLLPAITFQVQNSDLILLDVNPMVYYLFTPRISAGAGWNERLAFDGWSLNGEDRIYGPRVAFEFKLSKAINLRLIPEIMNTMIPPAIAQLQGINDPAYRAWVKSVFAGIKKDFTVYKKIKGNTEVLYNLYDPDGMSPYGDKLSIRFGFEFPMKKKVKN